MEGLERVRHGTDDIMSESIFKISRISLIKFVHPEHCLLMSSNIKINTKVNIKVSPLLKRDSQRYMQFFLITLYIKYNNIINYLFSYIKSINTDSYK